MLEVAKLDPKAVLPTRKFPLDAGIDLYARTDSPVIIEGGDLAIIHTGITLKIPIAWSGFIWPKSRNNHLIGGGVVDQAYQGEILIKVINTSKDPITISDGDAIAQLVLCPTLSIEVREVSKDTIHKNKSTRAGTGGIVTQSSFLSDVMLELEED